MTAAITVEGVSKRFRIYQEKYTSLKERMIHFGRIPYEEFWALKDINLEIPEGETLGLLGHNGSGKSTLLKCIGGILQPTTGEIAVRGRLAALLELGAGFHPELTGRENVFLNASILGMPKREIEKRFDEIVEFAELEQFIDNQVKHYSSGMYVRLGFAVAVNMEPEILLVDEVLAVGDEAFQRKCLDRVRRFQREGRTIIFVTHAADLVRQICDRVAVLDHGDMVTLDAPADAVKSFREHLMQGQRHDEAQQLPEDPPDDVSSVDSPSVIQAQKRNFKVRFTDVQLTHPHQDERDYILPGEPLTIRIAYEADEPVDDVVFGMSIDDQWGQFVYATNTHFLGVDVGTVDSPGVVTFSAEGVPLLEGTYVVTLGCHSHDDAVVYDWHHERYQFEVQNPSRTLGRVDLGFSSTIEKGRAATDAEGAA